MTRLPVVQLIDASGKPYDFVVKGDPRTYADLVKPAGLAEIAGYADGIGANKNLIFPRDTAGNVSQPTTLIRDAHALKLEVHAWTFRVENQFLPANFRAGNPADPNLANLSGNLLAEIKLFLGIGWTASLPITRISAPGPGMRANAAPSSKDALSCPRIRSRQARLPAPPSARCRSTAARRPSQASPSRAFRRSSEPVMTPTGLWRTTALAARPTQPTSFCGSIASALTLKPSAAAAVR
jgi:hypothetical protein